MNKEIEEFITEWDEYLRNRNGHGEREHIFARMVKLSEEMGELASEVLASQGEQRKEKLKDTNREELEDEFADVFLSLLFLAKSFDVDIFAASQNKVGKIRKRHAASLEG